MIEDDYYFYLLGRARDWIFSFISKLFPALPKLTGIFVLNFILLSSVYHWFGATLTNQDVYLAAMVLLLALFSDLKDFNFWGIKGTKKDEEKLRELAEQGSPALPDDTPQAAPEQQSLDVNSQAQPQPIYLMDDLTANFLYLSFEIEKLLRQSETRLSGKPVSSNMPFNKLIDTLFKRDFLTSQGIEQVKAIRNLRNQIVHGRGDEISQDSLYAGFNLAISLHTELTGWLYPQNQPQ